MQEKLLILRKRRNLTQSDVAKIIGLSRNSYSSKERGEIEFNSNEMFALKDYFGLPLEDIFLPRGHQNGDK